MLLSPARPDPEAFDVVVVGGGPAGLSAALWLGRCRRRVLLCDAGKPRNARARQLNGFLGHRRTDAWSLRASGREQLADHDVTVRDIEVVDARRVEGGFDVDLSDGATVRARKLLLATGMADEMPAIEGLQELYGWSVVHCPYCDGWEWRDRPLGVYGRGHRGVEYALEVRGWSQDLVLFTDGPPRIPPADCERLARFGVGLVTARIARLEGREGQLASIVLADGTAVAREALFVAARRVQASDLPARLGLAFASHGAVRTSRLQESSVCGVYVAGDAAKDVQFAVVAAAEGARAAYAINNALLAEDRGEPSPRAGPGERLRT